MTLLSVVPSFYGGSSRPASTIKTFVVLLHGKRMEGCPQSFELTRFGLRLGPFNHMTLLSVVPSFYGGSSRPASTIKTFVVLLHGKRMEGCPQSFELTLFGLRLGPFNHMTLLSVVPSFYGGSSRPASTIKTFVVLLHGKRMEGCPQSFELTRFGLRLGPFNHMTLLSVVPSFYGGSRGPASTSIPS